jgi:hypothetical protein
MKKIISTLGVLAFSFSLMNAAAQKIKTTEGDPSVLKNETNLNIEFTYQNLTVGKLSENEYVKKKTDEYNARTAGRGDIWAKAWVSDRVNRYEPKFIDLYMITSKKTVSKDAKYTMIFKTQSIEPGYNIAGGMMLGGRKSASIDAEVWIVETANRNNKIAVITVENAPGGVWTSNDYDAGTRISESYAISAKKLSKYIY